MDIQRMIQKYTEVKDGKRIVRRDAPAYVKEFVKGYNRWRAEMAARKTKLS